MVIRHIVQSFKITDTQLGGTTGYEEAAAQGLLAGANAGLYATRRPPLVLTRADGFLGVMVDDLITKGAGEPCKRQRKLFTECADLYITRGNRSNVHQSIRIPHDDSE